MVDQGDRDMSVYTPGQVWSILVNGSDDNDEIMDVWAGMSKLPEKQWKYLHLIAIGYSGAEAMERSGLQGNQTRLKTAALTMLTAIINGEKDE